MKQEEKIKMFNDVFAPQNGEKVLFLIDQPHDEIIDNNIWKDRREMVKDWINTFKILGTEKGFTVNKLEYKATGVHNSPIPQEVIDNVKKSNLVIAMTEFSATSTLFPLCKSENSNTRCTSMPGVERRMEETAFKADYVEVKRYSHAIEKMLNKTIGAEVLFSTGDKLYIDLRNRVAKSDAGDCTKIGQTINFPSGEGCKPPYEAASDEIDEFGESKTEGIMPVGYSEGIIKFVIKNNKITEVIGDIKKAEEMRKFFEKDETHRNIAELGIGCNPKAVVTGNILEDEKVGGLHIAYGMSSFLGGKIKSDMHQDICYPKGSSVEAKTLTLINIDGSKTELIKDSNLRYEILI